MPIPILSLPLRSCWKHRRTNAVMVATLAVLASVVIALLAIAHNLVHSPWTYDSDRFGVLRHGIAGAELQHYTFAPDEFRVLAQSGLFVAISASQSASVAYGDGSKAARSLRLVRTTAEALAVSDARPLLGRFVERGDSGSDHALVISHALWRSEFGGKPEVLGKTMLLNGQTYTIVGVMPPRFHYMGGDLWSAHLVDPYVDTAITPRLVVNFKLPEGSTIASLETPLAKLSATLPRASDRARYPNGWRLSSMLVIEAVSGPLRPAVMLVLAGAISLLLLGVLNIASMLVARQLTEAPLLATRLALGEQRWQAVAGAFVESLLLALASLLLALPLARILFTSLTGLLSVEWIPRELEGNFTFVNPALWSLPLGALGVACLLTAARLPALWRVRAGASLSASVRTGATREHGRALAALTALQVAIASAVTVTTLAIGTGADNLARRDLGYAAHGALHAQLVFPADRYPDLRSRAQALDRLQQQLREQTVASAVGFTDSAPLQRNSRTGVIHSWSGPALDQPRAVDYRLAQGELAQALELRLLEGRFLDGRDSSENEPVVVITRALAQQLAPGGSALGASLVVQSGAAPPTQRRVVGVVADVLHESGLATARPTTYIPYQQEPQPASGSAGGQIAAIIRYPAELTLTRAGLEAAVARVDPWLALYDVNTLEARAAQAVAGISLARTLFAGFAVLGVLLATMGIAAVAALGVVRRQHELAVRSAIGAIPGMLLMLVLRGSVRIGVLAGISGALLALATVQLFSAALQGVPELRVPDLILAPLLMALCATLAALGPARLAMRARAASVLRG